MGLDGKRVVKVCEVWFIGWVKFLLALGLESLTLDSINLANLMVCEMVVGFWMASSLRIPWFRPEIK